MPGYTEARFLTSAARPGQFLSDAGVEIAFAGRSNAGKSSAINAITGRRQLARTSRTPGRTQLINFFHLAEGRRLVDLPGYGFAQVPDKVRDSWQRLMETYFEERKSLRGLLLAVDSRRGLGAMDLQMLDWTGSLGRPAHVLLTKSDKLSRSEAASVLREATAACEGRASVQLFSAETGDGVVAARAQLEALLERG
ncbi:MAG: YihA family ribosome biogenesis GTP-binding protein [Gammaproteobacteria bacterium]|nr:YihA family ribosome biogenesis GTP-binding protein [Gammaproteobacteria bacterium]